MTKCWKCGFTSTDKTHDYKCTRCSTSGWTYFKEQRAKEQEIKKQETLDEKCKKDIHDMELTYYGHNGYYAHRYYNCTNCGVGYDSDDYEMFF